MFTYKLNILGVNVSKTFIYMLIKSKCSNATKIETLSNKMDDTLLEQCKVAHYLGVMVDENLTCDSHVSQLRRFIAYKISSLNRLRKCMKVQLIHQLYKSII